MRRIQISLLLFVIMLLFACGSKKSPTGGPEDTEKPSILSSMPAEYGDISSGIIEIDFSKAMDKSSLSNSVFFYPPIANRRISISRATMRIEIREKLQPDTYYYISLSNRIKDLRGNELDKAQTLIFKSGEPKAASLSGLIHYEKEEDKNSKIKVSVFSADSLLILMDDLRGSSYNFLALSPASYRLRAYMDKNLNGRYDTSIEPFFEDVVSITERGSMDISMVYEDTTLAQIKRVKQISTHELEIELSEEISKYDYMEILRQDSMEALTVIRQYLEGNILRVLTAKPDSSNYKLRLRNLKDIKGNISPESSISFRPTEFIDTIHPRVVEVSPRNGATVNDLQPLIRITFSEIILPERLKAHLTASDNMQEISLSVESTNGRTLSLRPQQELANYRSYKLVIHEDTQDYNGNGLESKWESVFLPIRR